MSAQHIMLSLLYKTYPKSSPSLYPRYSDTSPSHHVTHPRCWVLCCHSPPRPLLPVQHIHPYSSCLKPSCELSSMAFRIKSQITIPGLLCPHHLAFLFTSFPHPLHSPFSVLERAKAPALGLCTSCSLHPRLLFPLVHAWPDSPVPRVWLRPCMRPWRVASAHALCSCRPPFPHALTTLVLFGGVSFVSVFP